MKSSIKDFFSKCDQIRMKLRIWSYLLKKSLMEDLIFCAECTAWYSNSQPTWELNKVPIPELLTYDFPTTSNNYKIRKAN